MIFVFKDVPLLTLSSCQSFGCQNPPRKSNPPPIAPPPGTPCVWWPWSSPRSLFSSVYTPGNTSSSTAIQSPFNRLYINYKANSYTPHLPILAFLCLSRPIFCQKAWPPTSSPESCTSSRSSAGSTRSWSWWATSCWASRRAAASRATAPIYYHILLVGPHIFQSTILNNFK